MSGQSPMQRLLDLALLIGCAVTVCVFAVTAFVIAQIRHVNPLWVFFCLISIGFLAGVREEYRNQFRSIRFVLFVSAWLLINTAIIFLTIGYIGWFFLIPILFVEQVMFYATASWIFGVHPQREAD
jgi:hypothetical protein